MYIEYNNFKFCMLEKAKSRENFDKKVWRFRMIFFKAEICRFDLQIILASLFKYNFPFFKLIYIVHLITKYRPYIQWILWPYFIFYSAEMYQILYWRSLIKVHMLIIFVFEYLTIVTVMQCFSFSLKLIFIYRLL